MGKLSNQVIWITGASSGIGEALVYELARKGARLIISARRKEELERVKGNCQEQAQPFVRILPLDLSEPSTLQLHTEAAIQLFGHIDILINNGGISQRSLAKETELNVDRKIMEVDYFGTLALTKYLLPHFLARKKRKIAQGRTAWPRLARKTAASSKRSRRCSGRWSLRPSFVQSSSSRSGSLRNR